MNHEGHVRPQDRRMQVLRWPTTAGPASVPYAPPTSNCNSNSLLLASYFLLSYHPPPPPPRAAGREVIHPIPATRQPPASPSP
jgi:hypothetical protein